jgi:hypothetical protein
MYNASRSRGADKTGIPEIICISLAAIVALLAVALLLVSFRLTYGNIQTHLTQLYGEARTSRYFTPTVFHLFITRLRLGAACLFGGAIALVVSRRILGRPLYSFWSALSLSFRHERRARSEKKVADVATLAFIALIGLFLRLRFIDQPMRYDESATVLGYASKPFYLGLSIYNEPNNHLFHTLLVHIAMMIAGSAAWAVRLPTLIAGILLCVLTFAAARRFSNSTAALWAAAFVSASSILVEYSTNARGYTIVCCATMALLIAGFETLRRASPWWFFVFGATAVLGFWTIPIFLIPYGGVMLWLAWESIFRHPRFRKIFWLRLIVTNVVAGAATVMVYLPPIAVAGPNALFRNQWVAPRNLRSFLTGNLAQLRLTGQLWTRDLPFWWAVMLAMAFLLSLAFYPRLRRLLLSLFAWTVFLFIARRFVPFARNWLLFLPIYLTGAAAGLAWLFDRFIPATTRKVLAPISAIVAALILSIPILRSGSVLASTETGILKSAPEVANFVASRGIAPNQLFRNSTSDLPFQYYWWRRTGSRPSVPTRQQLEAVGVRDPWFLLNTTYGENLPAFSKQHGYAEVKILDKYSFSGADLYHVTEGSSTSGSSELTLTR